MEWLARQITGHRKGIVIVTLVLVAALALCAVAACARRRRPEAQALTLAILGATAYLLLFEVWPRYLFVFAPLYVLLATLALDRPLFARAGEKRQKA